MAIESYIDELEEALRRLHNIHSRGKFTVPVTLHGEFYVARFIDSIFDRNLPIDEYVAMYKDHDKLKVTIRALISEQKKCYSRGL